MKISGQLYQHHQEHRYVRYRDRLGEMLCFFLIFRATLFCHLFLIPTELNDNCRGLAQHIIVPPTRRFANVGLSFARDQNEGKGFARLLKHPRNLPINVNGRDPVNQSALRTGPECAIIRALFSYYGKN